MKPDPKLRKSKTTERSKKSHFSLKKQRLKILKPSVLWLDLTSPVHPAKHLTDVCCHRNRNQLDLELLRIGGCVFFRKIPTLEREVEQHGKDESVRERKRARERERVRVCVRERESELHRQTERERKRERGNPNQRERKRKKKI